MGRPTKRRAVDKRDMANDMVVCTSFVRLKDSAYAGKEFAILRLANVVVVDREKQSSLKKNNTSQSRTEVFEMMCF